MWLSDSAFKFRNGDCCFVKLYMDFARTFTVYFHAHFHFITLCKYWTSKVSLLNIYKVISPSIYKVVVWIVKRFLAERYNFITKSGLCHSVSSVCWHHHRLTSVTRVYCDKTTEATITVFNECLNSFHGKFDDEIQRGPIARGSK